MGRRKGSGIKINKGKWGKPTSVTFGSRGKGSVRIGKKGVKVNPPGCALLFFGLCLFGSSATLLFFLYA